MSTVAPKINTYLDFQGMGELRGQAQRDQDGALREVAQQFESMFVQMMMKSMREAGFGEGMLESREAETFQGMHDKEIAQQMARRGGLGIADMLVEQMGRNKQSVPTAADALSARRADMIPLEKPRKALDLNPVQPVFSVKRPQSSGMSLKPELSLPGASRRANVPGGLAE